MRGIDQLNGRSARYVRLGGSCGNEANVMID